MNPGDRNVTGDLICSVCGGPLRSDNESGFCARTNACVNARLAARYIRDHGEAPACRVCGLPMYRRSSRQHLGCRRTCLGCGGPVGYRNTTGYCTRNPDCTEQMTARREATRRETMKSWRRCPVCGQPVRPDSTTGICQRGTACRAAYAERRRALLLARLAAAMERLEAVRKAEAERLEAERRAEAEAARLAARLAAERNARHAAAMRAVWAARSEAERRRTTAAAAAASAAARDTREREQALAGRAGMPCPVCGNPVGRTGMCWRSAACIDDGMFLVLPGYNPSILVRTLRVTANAGEFKCAHAFPICTTLLKPD